MYFAALVLPEELNQKVLKYKLYMQDRYECRVGLKSPAHITIIAPFWHEEEKEKDLVRLVENISEHSHPFLISTDNFSAFKPKTIFIALKENEHLSHLKRKADEILLQHEEIAIKPDDRPFHPHITIATRDLYKKDFRDAWTHFAEKEFREQWIVEGLSLLRHNKKNWDVIYTSQFRNI
ncbi:MAG TPA: 2'-5' RNA ligase family protein [Chitinophagaceae bacterium]